MPAVIFWKPVFVEVYLMAQFVRNNNGYHLGHELLQKLRAEHDTIFRHKASASRFRVAVRKLKSRKRHFAMLTFEIVP